MYVCLCRGVTQKQIRREVLAGAVTYDQIQERLEVGLCCGTCSDTAREVISEALNVSLVHENVTRETVVSGETGAGESNVVQIESTVIQVWNPVRKAG